MTNQSRIPLSQITSKSRVRLIGIDAGHNLSHRLSELGLTPGVEFEVLQAKGKGPILLAVRGSRIALGRGMANKLMIEISKT